MPVKQWIASDVLATLQKLGKPQTAAIYKRHGSGENVFGTLTSDIAKLQKKIQIDDALAQELWKSGNAEARILSVLITDPAKLTRAKAEEMVGSDQVHYLNCYLSVLVARSPVADEAMRAWMESPEESHGEIGYGIFCIRLKDDPDSIRDADVKKVLAKIEAKIHGAPNWARYAMNSAVIAIGSYKPALRELAIGAAKRIGKVDIDHGETTCKTPDAVRYIEKAPKRTPCP